MTMESAIEQLAAAVRSQGEASAVAELIRQRDKAVKDKENVQYWRDWEERRANEYKGKLQIERRRTAALRGVIKRMKGKGM